MAKASKAQAIVPGHGSPAHPPHPESSEIVLWLEQIGAEHKDLVGGKAASLGELRREVGTRGVRIPNGFATTAHAYHAFLDTPVSVEGIEDLRAALAQLGVGIEEAAPLRDVLADLFDHEVSDDALALHERSAIARRLCLATPVPLVVRSAIEKAYRAMCREHDRLIDVAVRSSATREDSAEASFAGQYESFLNVRGVTAVLDAWRRCAASAFTERVVSYQVQRGMDPRDGAVSVVVQLMVRSDLASSGVLFTLDPDSGNRNVMVITGAYGLGEPVVQGSVSPDTYVVWKEGLRRGADAVVHRSLGSKDVKMVYADDGDETRLVPVEAEERDEWVLTDAEVAELARMALLVEEHYGRPMDIEWAKDGNWGALFVVQARPETVHAGASERRELEVFSMDPGLMAELQSNGRLRAEGQSVGSRIATGRVRRYDGYRDVIEKERRLRALVENGVDPAKLDAEDRVFEPGDVLVTGMTTPDWEPLMKKASLIVTEKGGRTSHAAIVAREFGIPAIVGCGEGARSLEPLTEVTGTCAEGDIGYVFEGAHPFEVQRVEASATDQLHTRIKLNVGFPDRALRDAMLPSDGVGLARVEFILTSQIGIHPTLLAHFDALETFVETGVLPQSLAPFEDRLGTMGTEALAALLAEADERTSTAECKRSFFVDRLKEGVARICAAFHPRPVLVRLSDMKSNEYRDLLGGRLFEPEEENPMIAWRGAARYTDPRFRLAFDMECDALRSVREDMGLDNLQIMVPFCRTPEEGRRVVDMLEERGLSPDGVPLFLMVELPSNVIDAEAFIEEMGLAGGSMGTNDLVQTVYALSRDDLGGYPSRVDARSPAVRSMMREAIRSFREHGLEIGICGQAPSDHPDEIPSFLVECGITSISVTSDTLLQVREAVKRAETEKGHGRSRVRPA